MLRAKMLQLRLSCGPCIKRYRIITIKVCGYPMMLRCYYAMTTGEIFANCQNFPINQEVAVMAFIIILIMWADQEITSGSTQIKLNVHGSKCILPMHMGLIKSGS